MEIGLVSSVLYRASLTTQTPNNIYTAFDLDTVKLLMTIFVRLVPWIP